MVSPQEEPKKLKRVKKDKPKKLASKCLLLKTPDGACFFTEVKHFPCLIEFGRTFEAEISIVQTKEEVEVLELDDLAKSICAPEHETHPEYEVLEIKLNKPQKKSNQSRAAKSEQGRSVVQYIIGEMVSGKTMTNATLESQFPNVTKPCLNNHYTRARRELRAQGHLLKKEKPGTYSIVKKVEKPKYETDDPYPFMSS